MKEKAIQLHKGLGFEPMRVPMGKDRWKIFGRSTVREEGEKNDLSYLLALELTGATSLVAVCDEVKGFSRKGSDNVKGNECDIYINGKKIKTVDTIEGNAIFSDKKSKTIRGATEKKETMEIGKFGSVPKTLKILEGNITLNSDIDKKKPLSIVGNHPINIGPKNFEVNGKFTISLKEKINKDGELMTFPCRITKPKTGEDANVVRITPSDPEYPYSPQKKVMETLGFKCVNYAKIIDKSDKGEYNFFI